MTDNKFIFHKEELSLAIVKLPEVREAKNGTEAPEYLRYSFERRETDTSEDDTHADNDDDNGIDTDDGTENDNVEDTTKEEKQVRFL